MSTRDGGNNNEWATVWKDKNLLFDHLYWTSETWLTPGWCPRPSHPHPSPPEAMLLCDVMSTGLLVPSQSEGLQDEGPADGAVLEVCDAAVAHTGVSTGQQHDADGCALAHHAVPAALLFLLSDVWGCCGGVLGRLTVSEALPCAGSLTRLSSVS